MELQKVLKRKSTALTFCATFVATLDSFPYLVSWLFINENQVRITSIPAYLVLTTDLANTNGWSYRFKLSSFSIHRHIGIFLYYSYLIIFTMKNHVAVFQQKNLFIYHRHSFKASIIWLYILQTGQRICFKYRRCKSGVIYCNQTSFYIFPTSYKSVLPFV